MITVLLLDSNAVVVARHFNPSIVTQHWLVRNEILKEEDFERGGVFTDMIVQVRAKEFVLLVTPDQMQFSPVGLLTKQQDTVCDKLGKIVNLLPQTPYIAVGLNFLWKFEPQKADPRQLSREFFFVPDSPFHKAFAGPDARFGGYLSKDALGCRLKLDVKPTVSQVEGREVHSFLLNFNYHLDLEKADRPVDLIQGMFRRWNEAFEQARQIVQDVAERDTA